MLPGGFSYGDYLKAVPLQKILAPLWKSNGTCPENGGFVFGVCNGLNPLRVRFVAGALLHNDSRKFICRNVLSNRKTPPTTITSKSATNKALRVPIAHGEGNTDADADAEKAER